MGGILSGKAIEKAVMAGEIEIEPFTPEQLNPASYDLTLGDQVRVYTGPVYAIPKNEFQGQEYHGGDLVQCREILCPSALGITLPEETLDSAKDNPTAIVKMSQAGFMLKPGIGYLLHTVERIRTDKFVPIVDGKSSTGRLFICAHVTAGYGDPGFNGQYTLETTVTHPVIVYPGMRFAQMRFHTLVGEPLLYAGNYTGEASRGPVASRSYKQFEKKEKA